MNLQVAQIVPLRRKPATALLLWSTRREDGHGTSIETVPAWNFDGCSVLLFRCQPGAADGRAGFCGIGADQIPTRLGAIEGSLNELLDINGSAGLRVYETADMRHTPLCLREAGATVGATELYWRGRRHDTLTPIPRPPRALPSPC